MADVPPQMQKQLEKAVPKFVNYFHAAKLVILEFYGESFSVENMKEMLGTAGIPTSIDEVWAIVPEPISGDEYELNLRAVRCAIAS